MSSPSSLRTRLLGAGVAAACVTVAAQADEFSWQLSGAKHRFEAGGFDSDSWAVDATYYMKPLADSAGPFALASFLNPTTRVSATANRTDNPTEYRLGGAYVLPGEKWYVGAEYAKANAKDTPYLTFSDPKGYGIQAGRYLGANTTLELRLDRSEMTTWLTCPSGQVCIGFPVETEAITDSVSLEVFHVRRFRSLTYSLQGGVSERNTDIDIRPTAPFGTPWAADGQPVRQYSVATELFPTERFGVRLGYSRPDRDFRVDSYDVAATWFFKPRVAVQFGLSRTTLDDPPPGLGRSEGARVRFIGRL